MDFSVPSTKDSPGQNVELNNKLSELVDGALVKAREAEPRRTYLGGSRLGHPKSTNQYDRGCERALWYEWKGYPSDKPFDADLYRVFDMGHDAEARTAAYLRLAGFQLHTEKPGGGQFGFAVAPDPETGEPRVKGHLDGVIMGGPDIRNLLYPALWENKALKSKKWMEFRTKGVERSHAYYYGQTQIYMGFMNLKTCLFSASNRDTGEVWYEIIPFNQDHAQAAVDRAQRVISAKKPTELSRIATDYTCFACKWCSYASHCKRDEEGLAATVQTTQPTQTPEWMK